MEKRTANWYVSRRGELLAEQFLLELQPDSIVASPKDNLAFDFIAIFTKPDRTPVTIGIEVKTTQHEIGGHFEIKTELALRLLKSNIPVLVIVVDAKTNEIYFNWIVNAIPPDKQAVLQQYQTCTLQLRRGTKEEIEQLRSELLGNQLLAV